MLSSLAAADAILPHQIDLLFEKSGFIKSELRCLQEHMHFDIVGIVASYLAPQTLMTVCECP